MQAQYNIVVLAGRKGSGKGVASSFLMDTFGFKRISMADPLKDGVCSLFDWDRTRMTDLAYKEEILESPVEWGAEGASYLEQFFSLPCGVLDRTPHPLPSRRVALQFIGTDILRAYDENFHVNQLLKVLDPNEKWVLDDVRFSNELQPLKDRGALCVFIVRPNNWDYSNHASEISLRRQDLDHLLLNDLSLGAFEKSCNWFFSTMLGNPKFTIDQVKTWIAGPESTGEKARKLGFSRDKLVWWARKYALRLEDRDYPFNDNAFSLPTPEAAYWAGYLSADGCLKKSGASQHSFIVDLTSIDQETAEGFMGFMGTTKPSYYRPPSEKGYEGAKPSYQSTVMGSLILDDLKLWGLRPRKGVYNELPSIALQDDLCMKSWYIGLIDGDGTIYHRGKDKGLTIQLLGSEEVLNYLKAWSPAISDALCQEKDVEGLYRLTYHGGNAEEFAAWLNPEGKGLSRKWDKVKTCKHMSTRKSRQKRIKRR